MSQNAAFLMSIERRNGLLGGENGHVMRRILELVDSSLTAFSYHCLRNHSISPTHFSPYKNQCTINLHTLKPSLWQNRTIDFMATQIKREEKIQAADSRVVKKRNISQNDVVREVKIQPEEQRVVKKRKIAANNVVFGQQEEEAEAEVVKLSEESSGTRMGLLPWWPSDMIDERMSWSMVWLPSWDAEFVGRAYHLLYDDVAWDDDIWGLKSIHEIPPSRTQM